MSCTRKPKVSSSSPAGSHVQRWTSCSNCLANLYVSARQVEVVVKEIAFPFPCCPVNRECSRRKTQREKKISTEWNKRKLARTEDYGTVEWSPNKQKSFEKTIIYTCCGKHLVNQDSWKLKKNLTIYGNWNLRSLLRLAGSSTSRKKLIFSLGNVL